LFPDEGITKGDLIDYYRRIADTMLPHMAGRPISMHRFPNGIHKAGFYHKEVPDYFPDWITRVAVQVEEEGVMQLQVICDKPETLVYLANQACVTPHIWLSRADKLHYPDKMIFDLDPPGGEFDIVRLAARSLREILEDIGLASFIMTTGSRGLHVVVPLDRSADFDEVRLFAKDVAQLLADKEPGRFTVETRKDKRDGRLFLDYLRNSYAQHGVAPYAVRAKPGAPVATPLDWEELANPNLTSASYTMQTIFQRLAHKQDPWKDMMRHARSLKTPRRRLERLTSVA
jgi:bifunctional non-homologous end joining protein LigD